ncbi:MAG: CIA30 family protein, partial [Planctomycetaceae bacterium]|nr:CIA30 family protein [Planctomycetaceae bacterium]
MKGVESKCCGVARYFPFVLPYYEENDNNFGMLDRQGTPLRSMAGYTQMIRVLAHTEYVGDLKNFSKVMRARVFHSQNAKKDDNAVIVLYTGNMPPMELTELPATLEVIKAESVTGETLPTNPLVITNGLIYLFAKVPENLIDTDTQAMKMLEGSKKPHVKREAIPFVTVFDSDQFNANSMGYRINRDMGTELRIPFTVYDFSNIIEIDSMRFSRILPDIVKTGVLYQSIGVKPQRFEDRISFDKALESLEEIQFKYLFEARQRFASNIIRDTISFRFLNELTWDGLLENYKDNAPLDISPEKWTPSSSGNMSIDAAENGGVVIKCTFGNVDKWCYPRIAVLEGIELVKYSGVILRARTQGETTPRFFLHERDTGAGYMTEAPLFPADGEWHAVYIPFDRLVYCGATPSDPNGKLDLENVDTLSIGFNTKSPEATLEISNCILVKP